MNLMTKYTIEKAKNSFFSLNKYVLEKSKDDKYIVKINKDGKFINIGSKYNVSKDINEFIEQAGEYNIYTVFVVFGLGAGEHIVELLNNLSEKNKIFIVEPDENIIALLADNDYYNKLFDDSRVILYNYKEEELKYIFARVIGESEVGNIKLMIYANYDRIFQEKLSLFYKMLKDFLNSSLINIATNIYFSEQFFKCYVRNMKYIIKSIFINEIKNKFKNIPAVIVSAGPSLEKNIRLLKEVKDKFIIIAGGRTAKSVMDLGINPDFICTVDPGEPAYNTIKDAINCEVPLIFCECSNYKIIKEYKGKKIFFKENAVLGDITTKIIGEKVDGLWQGGSVAHICTSLASYVGCNPIIFIGQDLAYTDDKLHADTASLSSENNLLKEDSNTILVEDIHGGKVRTSKVLDAFRRYMEDRVESNKDIIFINSTEGGANIKGTVVKTLREVIDEYSKDEELDKALFDFMTKENDIDKAVVKSSIEEILFNLDEINKECKDAIEYAGDILNYYKDNNKDMDIHILFDKIKYVNNKIQEITFIDTMLKPTIYKILMDPNYLEKANESEKDMGIRLAKQIKVLYDGIIKAIDKAKPYIEECVEELS